MINKSLTKFKIQFITAIYGECGLFKQSQYLLLKFISLLLNHFQSLKSTRSCVTSLFISLSFLFFYLPSCRIDLVKYTYLHITYKIFEKMKIPIIHTIIVYINGVNFMNTHMHEHICITQMNQTFRIRTKNLIYLNNIFSQLSVSKVVFLTVRFYR